MKPTTVTLPSSKRLSGVVEGVLAGLPASFEIRERGDVATIEGNGEWPRAALAAISAGHRGVMVMEPIPVSLEALDAVTDAASSRGTSMRLARQWASNPAAAALRAEQHGDPFAALIDSQAMLHAGTPLINVIAAQTDLLLTVLGGSVEFESVARATDAYVVTGRLRRGDRAEPVLLAGRASAAHPSRARVRELLATGRRSVEVFNGRSAQPALVRLGDESGERLFPTVYETGYRAAWRLLRDDLGRGRAELGDLLAYGAVLTSVARVAESL